MARRSRPGDHLTSGAQHLLAVVGSTALPVYRAGVPLNSAALGVALAERNRRWMRRAGLVTPGTKPLVGIGQHAAAGETVLAKLS